jgi:hypothetical protein
VSGRGAVLDLRIYRLRPGAGETFGRIFRDVLPLLTRSGIDVVAHGSSLDDSHLYYLVRSFGSAAERDGRLDAFYGSDEWRGLHRDRVLALIEGYRVLLLPVQPIHDGLSG